MAENSYELMDALTGAHLKCFYPGMRALQVEVAQEPLVTDAIFFPGCSFLNYGMPLVQSVDALLQEQGVTQGTSLLCCGKILSYEEDGKAKRESYENELRAHLKASKVKKIITACPNCTKALRELIEKDEETQSIEVTPLPVILADLGYRLDENQVKAMVRQAYSQADNAYGVQLSENDDDLYVSIHDACPDRDLGEFAASVRQMVGENLIHEMEHNRKKSLCCGSLVRAAGKFEAAVVQSKKRGEEALAAQTSAIVTPCMSCTYLLSVQQQQMPVFHYLELLFNWRIDWAHANEYMKMRFLFEGSWGVFDEQGQPITNMRSFIGLEQ